MDKMSTARKNLLRQLQCAICLDGVKDARLCPRCSQFYCNRCIQNWMKKSCYCPKCQVAIRSETLVVGRSINEMQESCTQLLDSMDENLCGRRKRGRRHRQQLTLFCYSCEASICDKCWFSSEHVEHKERVVPLDEAFEHYKHTLEAALVWVNGRKELIQEGLKQVTKNQQDLSSEYEQIEKLRDESEKLVAGAASSAALTNILDTVGTITELRSKRQRDTEAIRIDRRGDFMLEPTVLVFCITEFSKILDEKDSYEINCKDPNGFVWKCTLYIAEEDDDDDEEAEGDEEEDEDDDEEEHEDDDEEEEYWEHYRCHLSLIEGKPSEYSVTFGNHPEKVLGFELDKSVMIGTFEPDVYDDTCRVTVEIRQTYADRIQQLQDHIAQLEKESANQKSFRNFLSDYEKSMAPASG